MQLTSSGPLAGGNTDGGGKKVGVKSLPTFGTIYYRFVCHVHVLPSQNVFVVLTTFLFFSAAFAAHTYPSPDGRQHERNGSFPTSQRCFYMLDM